MHQRMHIAYEWATPTTATISASYTFCVAASITLLLRLHAQYYNMWGNQVGHYISVYCKHNHSDTCYMRSNQLNACDDSLFLQAVVHYGLRL